MAAQQVREEIWHTSRGHHTDASPAQSSCTVSATQTIQSAGDATALAGCTTFTGSIQIASSTTDQIALNGITRITGDLVANNVSQVSLISGDSLTTIGGSFTLMDVQLLTTLSFPQLTTVGNLNWVGLPNLQGLSFTTGLKKVSSLVIDNTQLNSLSGINLQTADSVMISNNPYLGTIDMQIGNVSQALAIEANSRNTTVTFPNLEWAYNITFRNVSSVNIASLAYVNDSMGFFGNYFESVSAPNLTYVGSSLSFVSNEALANASFPQLTTVDGGLQYANNTATVDINGFPALQTVGGAFDAYGNFSR